VPDGDERVQGDVAEPAGLADELVGRYLRDDLRLTVTSAWARSTYTRLTEVAGASGDDRMVMRKPSAARAPVTTGASRTTRRPEPVSVSGCTALSRWPPFPRSEVTEAR
jgi:hypothetical protein